MSENKDNHVGLDRFTERLEALRDSKADKRAEGQLTGQKARGWAEKLFARVFYGAIYALLTIACLFLGRIPTLVLIATMAWLNCSEFFRIARLGGRMPNEVFGLVAAVLFPLAAHVKGITAMLILSFLLLIACSIWYVFTPRATIGDVAITFFGPLYTSMTFSCMILIRAIQPNLTGALLSFGIIFSIWANDAMAYFVGSRIGKHPLAPRISPNKSWEGFAGGLIASIVVWLVMGISKIHGLSIVVAIAGGLIVGFMSVMGDLFESRLKRGVGIKDSGDLMPGHGGMLDRSDSILFGSVAAYFVLLAGGFL